MEATASEIHIKKWDEKIKAFLATNPKCKECGNALDHYSRTMICRQCQKIIYKNRARAREPELSREYRRKHKKKIQAYQAKYYRANQDAISERKKMQYKEKKAR